MAHQDPNAGLGAARNVGAAAATGEIVAYIDADAWPDPHWLHYLADSFDRTGSAAVGGPNIPPLDANAVARSVAHSPGGPIHVLLSDTEAEHIPGCNFSIRKDVLDELGGFDAQFHAAGDDVDLCWRLQEAGHGISFNPAAMVWHHRRNSVRAYWRQQRGYGRAEALLERKWPQRYNAAGHVSWGGDMYGSAFARLAFKRSRIYNGVCGFAPFQTLYQGTPSVLDSLARLPEWYLGIAVLACLSALGVFWAPLLYVVPLLGAALILPLVDALYSGLWTRFGLRRAREVWQLRAITSFLHATQPLARLVGRIGYGLTPWRRPSHAGFALPRRREVAIWLETWREPEDRLADLTDALRRTGLAVRLGGAFDQWDAEVTGWHCRCGTAPLRSGRPLVAAGRGVRGLGAEVGLRVVARLRRADRHLRRTAGSFTGRRRRAVGVRPRAEPPGLVGAACGGRVDHRVGGRRRGARDRGRARRVGGPADRRVGAGP